MHVPTPEANEIFAVSCPSVSEAYSLYFSLPSALPNWNTQMSFIASSCTSVSVPARVPAVFTVFPASSPSTKSNELSPRARVVLTVPRIGVASSESFTGAVATSGTILPVPCSSSVQERTQRTDNIQSPKNFVTFIFISFSYFLFLYYISR